MKLKNAIISVSANVVGDDIIIVAALGSYPEAQQAVL